MTDSKFHVPGFFGKMMYRQGAKEDQKVILDLCDGEHTAAEIAKKIGKPLEITEKLLDQMYNEGHIVPIKIWERTVYLLQK